MISTILAVIAVPVVLGISTLVIMALAKLFSWLKEKVKNDQIQHVFQIVHDAVDSVVSTLSDDMVADLKAKCADGKLTMEEAHDALEAIITKVKLIVGPKFESTVNQLGIVFGDIILAILAKHIKEL